MKNIAVKCLVFTLSLLMTDACPDFTDNFKDFSTSHTETSIVAYLIDLTIGNQSHQTVPSNTASSSQNHSIEIDAFLVVSHKAATPFILFLTQLESIYHTPSSEVVIDVIPMPPSILG